MGFKKVNGIEFECDNCGTALMTAGDADLDGSPIPPKGWFTGSASESTGARGSALRADWIACKASCIGQAARKMVEAARPDDNATPVKDPDD